jgi:enediyne biosynthesis protein E4
MTQPMFGFTSYAERPLLFHNLNNGAKFDVIPAVEGTGLADVIPARGAAFGDLFNNGKTDVVINYKVCCSHYNH